ncbi:diacylglycerol kinase [Acinetobacter sp. 3657]|uniref:diacylglycerol kinase n=1 Tax=Acinetobacter sp. 3657 TaxID=2817764 RepID=UPI00285B1D35|nr:diacylglycerol kinase [Prolinoborus sp. 3657]
MAIKTTVLKCPCNLLPILDRFFNFDSYQFFIHVSALEQALIVAVCLLAIIVELFNSAIEAVVEHISLEKHELSKNAKDMGSTAQFVSLAIIFFSWIIILFR